MHYLCFLIKIKTQFMINYQFLNSIYQNYLSISILKIFLNDFIKFIVFIIIKDFIVNYSIKFIIIIILSFTIIAII